MKAAMRGISFLALIASFALTSCSCDKTVTAEEKSPSDDKLASVTTVDCGGALGGASTQVNVRLSNTPLATGNIAFSIDAKVLLTVRWQDNQTLVVHGPKGLFSHPLDNRIKTRRLELNGVRIDYREL